MKKEIGKQPLIAIIVPNEQVKARYSQPLGAEIERGEVIVYVLPHQNIRSAYQELTDLHVGVILARGGTYRDLLALDGSIPLIEMEISMLDILETLQSAEAEGKYERINLVLHANTAYNEELCQRFIHIPVLYKYFYDAEEIPEIMQEIAPGELVVGSGFISEYIKERNIVFRNVLSRPGTIRSYYNQARHLLDQMRQEIAHTAQLQAALAQIQEGVIILDADGVVCNSNPQSSLILGSENKNLNGLLVQDLIPEFPFFSLLGQIISSPRSKLISLNGSEINLSIVSYSTYRAEQNYLLTLQTVRNIQRLEQNIRFALLKKGLVAEYSFEDILTANEEMQLLIRHAKIIAKSDGAILLNGESGTGKELFAQSIHQSSSRSNGPFVAINCAALNESLLESELFGYVGGAFTGARKDGKAGLFELAHKGTIFLDEINSMPVSLQTKLLRVIEEQQVMRLGSDYVIPLDIRIISASNQDLMTNVREHQFRLDLYYRLNTFELTIPPLRKRKEDIELLFRYYLAKELCCKPESIELPNSLLHTLLEHSWLGNVRELKSTALRYIAYGGDNSLGSIIDNRANETNEAMLTTEQGHIDLGVLKRTVEDLVIQSLLAQGMSKNETAKTLGISRQALHKKITRLSYPDDNGG